MEFISYFAISYILFIPAYIYWAQNKKAGRYILTVFAAANALNATVKLTACIYRPWIRDPRIVPAGNAIATAGGYSFPSGHSVWSSSQYGATAYCIKKWGRKILAGFVLAVLGLIYITLKPYPMTYVDGALLVDPVKMRYDGMHDITMLAALTTAIYVDKRWIKYEVTELKGLQFVVLAAAGIGLYWVIIYLKPMCINSIGPNVGRIVHSFLLYHYMIVLVPLVMKLSAGGKKEPAEAGDTENLAAS